MKQNTPYNDMTSASVFCFGELLIDMISTTTGDLSNSEGFLKKFGGAPANTAAGLAKLGIPTFFAGKVGDDPFGHFLKTTLAENKVGTSHLVLSKEQKTTLAFVSLTQTGDRDFTFYKGAHESITPDEVTLPQDTFLFHFGSLTQINSPGKEATEKLLSEAETKGCIISYDPNIRESLWIDLQKAREVILKTATRAHILKVNEEEALLLAGTDDLQTASTTLFTDNLDVLFITRGAQGCYYKTKTTEGTIPTIPVHVVDTTGAGDAFNAAYISALYNHNKRFSELSKEEVEQAVKRAIIIAALTTTKKGAISAFPTQEEIIKHLV